MTYVIYYYLMSDGQAPAQIDLVNYKLVGTVKAGSLSEAQRKWREKRYLRCIAGHRPLGIGDVIRDHTQTFHILTGTRWASVEVVESLDDSLL